MKNYYEILGVSSDATSEEIKGAFRKLSKKFHPDKNEGDKFFEEKFKLIYEAYSVLSSPIDRALYDKNFLMFVNDINHILEYEKRIRDEKRDLDEEKEKFRRAKEQHNDSKTQSGSINNNAEQVHFGPKRNDNIFLNPLALSLIAILFLCIIWAIFSKKYDANNKYSFRNKPYNVELGDTSDYEYQPANQSKSVDLYGADTTREVQSSIDTTDYVENYALQYKKYSFVTVTYLRKTHQDGFYIGNQYFEPRDKLDEYISYSKIIEFDYWDENVKYKFLDEFEEEVRRYKSIELNFVGITARECYVFDSYVAASKRLEKLKSLE